MSRAARYAIYQTPHPDSGLWSLASCWLGRDAATGAATERPSVSGLANCNLDRLTAVPRHYGFHGTLKAPFEPAAGFDEADLRAAMRDFARSRSPFEVPLDVGLLGDFLALRPLQPSSALDELHRDCVREFDVFRAPIAADDLARRRHKRLTPEQNAYLARWGYPHIFEHFRFHMTLTSRIACRSSHEAMRTAVDALFAPLLVEPIAFEGIALFAQPDRETPFRMLGWYPFRGSAPPLER